MLRLWSAVQTQWSHGPLGPTGFNWQSLRVHPEVCSIPEAERESLLRGVADMERAWLAQRHRMQAAEARGKALGA